MKTFNIGDVVQINKFGKCGKVIDKMYSEAYDRFFFEVEYDETSNLFQADDLMHDEDAQAKYHFTIEQKEGVVIAVLYDDNDKEVARGHGHVLHNGVVGFTQAASYALKRIYTDMNGGKMLCYNMEEGRYE